MKTQQTPLNTPQPDTSDVHTALERSKAYTRKLHADVQKITPTPAQAQPQDAAPHSPLPHVKENFRPRLDVALDKMRHNIVPELSVCIIAEAYDALQAHAQRLADALAKLLENATLEPTRQNTYIVLAADAVIASQALAQWEQAQ